MVYCGYNCGQILTQANPSDPDPLEQFRLFAIMGTWMEADVVAANVSNALTQGCERVYLVDNNSPDETVKVAVCPGAMLLGLMLPEKPVGMPSAASVMVPGEPASALETTV